MEVDQTEQAPRKRGPEDKNSLGRQLLRQRMFPAQTPVAKIGRYVVLRFVGAGGMGQVFAAYDPVLDRKVAVKLLPEELGEELEQRTRLMREAQALAKLSHPNVVQVYEAGEHEGQVYVVMEFVAGRTLGEWVAGEDGKDRPGTRAILDKFMQAGRGLAAAHEAGLVHRDFKPSNVIVDEQGCARVLDFGLVADAGELGERERGGAIAPTDSMRALEVELTTTGTMLGTPAYMAPEQFAGARIDARSDQFGFCVALFEALTGTRPFAGRTAAELMTKVREGERVRVPVGRKLSRRLSRALDRGLAISAQDRWPAMSDLLAALEPPSRRRIWTIGAAALLTVAGLGTWHYERQLEASADQIVHEKFARAKLERAGERGHNRRLMGVALDAPDNPQRAIEHLREVDLELEPDLTRWIQTASERVEAASVPAQVIDLPTATHWVEYGPEGRWLAVGGFGVELRVWAVGADGSLEAASLDGPRKLRQLAFNPARSGEIAVVGNGLLRLLSLTDDGAAVDLEVGEGRVKDPRFSPDGRWLAALTGGRDNQISLWSVAGEATPVELEGRERAVAKRLVFSPDGSQLAVAFDDGVVALWTLGSEGPPALLGGPRGEFPASLAFSPDASRLAVGYRAIDSSRAPVRLWDLHALAGEDRRPALELEGHRDGVGALAFSPDGARLVSGSRDRSVRVWELAGLDARWSAEVVGSRVLHGHGDSVDVRVSPDGRTIVSVSAGMIRMWPSDASAGPRALPGRTLSLSPDGARMAVLDRGKLLIHELGDAGPRPGLARRLDTGGYYNSRFGELAAPDAEGRWLAASLRRGWIDLWSTKDWRLERSYRVDPRVDLQAVVVAPDGRVAACGEQGELRSWPLDERAPTAQAEFGGEITACAFSPDSGRLVVTGRHGQAAIWTPEGEGGELRKLPAHGSYVSALAFSADGRSLASASVEGEIFLWPSLEREEPLRLGGQGQAIASLEFGPAGERLLSASADGVARLWSVAEARELRRFEHEDEVVVARFHPEGSSLLTASGELLRLWSLEGEDEPKLLRHDAELVDARFSPSGDRVLTITSDSDGHLWTLGGSGPAEAVDLEGNAAPFHISGLSDLLGPGRVDPSADPVGVAFVDGGAELIVRTEDSVWIWDADYSREALLTWMWRSFPVCPTTRWRVETLGLELDAAEEASERCEQMLDCTDEAGYGACRERLFGAGE